MSPVETYLEELNVLRASGAVAQETSGYGALASLLNELGATLKPKVRCLLQLKNSGAGLPDGGVFLPEQLKDADEAAPLLGQKPARGIVEVKAPAEELPAIAQARQVQGYLAHYGVVLLTNYRDFLLLERGPLGGTLERESFRLAESEAAFWDAAAHPRETAAALGERLAEYLKRALLHAAPLDNSKDLACFLASYARDARVRVEAAGDLPALTASRDALEASLGMKFEAGRGEHFFRSTLVQTLFYGVFSAWVLWHKAQPLRRDAFDWRAAAWTLHVPMIKALFEQVATPTKLGPLGLVEVLDWTAAVLNRVDRPAFFEQFLETHAVQYFYEPFLEAFDPELRKQLGVWYTPPEIVEYQVARVDTVLREELGLADGLADEQVFVLDPCCGTGAYLVEVLRRIARTIKEEKGKGVASLAEARRAAMERVHGFELMPAPFVVAHLQMGLLLQSLGVPLDEAKGERAGIFLANALTGWDFVGENPHLDQWPEMQAERKGAGLVKTRKPILVILGNPPYNAYAGVSPAEEQGLVEPYKEGLNTRWGIKKFNLDDLYVRFFRIAERKIAERTRRGIVCFISNFSYLSDPSFVVMRQRFLKEFDTLWFDCLNGDSRETGKLTPDGLPDPSVFSTEANREGIRVGTAVCLMVRHAQRKRTPKVRYREFWGVGKRADLLGTLELRKSAQGYESAKPAKQNRYSFRPASIAPHYLGWPRLVELCAEPPSNGLMEKRGGALIDMDRAALTRRMAMYYDSSVPWERLVSLGTGLTEDAARFDARKERDKVTAAERFHAKHVLRYALRPFDTRWCYYSAERPLWNEPRPKLRAQCWEDDPPSTNQPHLLWNRSRPALWAQCWKGNAFLMSRPAGVASPEGVPFCYTPLLGDNDFLRGHAYYFPLRLRSASGQSRKRRDDGNGEFGSILHETAPAYGGDAPITANLSPAARAYLAGLGIKHPDADADTAALLWLHALAVGYSPAYLAENADGLRQDWPRIPLPDSRKRLLASAALGRQVAALLDTEAPVPGVTAIPLRPELARLAVPHATGAPDFRLTAGWGHSGKEGVTMPGKGRLLARAHRPEEQPAPRQLDLLGRGTFDVYLNDTTCWRNVPERVWDFTIGGYQVLKKRLSYREHALLGRALTTQEVEQVADTARRLAALLLLQPELDASYAAVKAGAHEWKA